MLDSLTQSFLPFMGWFTVGSVISSFYYGAICGLRKRATEWVSFFEVICIMLLLCLIPMAIPLLLMFWAYPLLLVAFAVVCSILVGGALAEKAVGFVKSSLTGYIGALVCVIFLGVITSLALLAFSLLPLDAGDDWQTVGLGAGLVLAPISIPAFIWLWRNTHMRPGIGRHLNSFDEINQPR